MLNNIARSLFKTLYIIHNIVGLLYKKLYYVLDINLDLYIL